MRALATFFPSASKSPSPVANVIMLPLAGSLASLCAGCRSAVDRPHIALRELLAAKTVEDLDLVFPHHVEARVRTTGNHDLQLNNRVAELLLAVNVATLAAGIDQLVARWFDDELTRGSFGSSVAVPSFPEAAFVPLDLPAAEIFPV